MALDATAVPEGPGLKSRSRFLFRRATTSAGGFAPATDAIDLDFSNVGRVSRFRLEPVGRVEMRRRCTLLGRSAIALYSLKVGGGAAVKDAI